MRSVVVCNRGILNGRRMGSTLTRRSTKAGVVGPRSGKVTRLFLYRVPLSSVPLGLLRQITAPPSTLLLPARRRLSIRTPTIGLSEDTIVKLSGKRVAILIAPRGTEDPEFAKPKAALEQEGAVVTVVGLEIGEATTVNHDLDPGLAYKVDKAVTDVSASVFDALVVPGGCVGADKLRGSSAAIALVREFFAGSKPVGAICHAPWTLVEAGVVEGRTLTSYPTLQTDIRNAGGTWVDQEVCVDGGLVTSRNPHDLPAFCAELVEAIAAGPAVRQTAAA